MERWLSLPEVQPRAAAEGGRVNAEGGAMEELPRSSGSPGEGTKKVRVGVDREALLLEEEDSVDQW